MSVKASDLSTPERDLDLMTREPRGANKVAEDIQKVKTGKPTTEDQLKGIRERIDLARGIVPEVGPDRHCLDCWEKGRNAAIRMIEGDKGA